MWVEQSSTGGSIWSWGCGSNTQGRVLGLLVQACEQWGTGGAAWLEGEGERGDSS